MLLNLEIFWPTSLDLYKLATWIDVPCCTWNVSVISSTIWDPLVVTATRTLKFDYRVCETFHSVVWFVSLVLPSKKYSIPECFPLRTIHGNGYFTASSWWRCFSELIFHSLSILLPSGSLLWKISLGEISLSKPYIAKHEWAFYTVLSFFLKKLSFHLH